ncbi:Uncharacterised protein [Pseudomonas aeruginosa]|nr:Uncharacterised protein [Pseudomonas aeruginosa]
MLAAAVGLAGHQARYHQGADPGNRGDQADVQADLAVEEAGDAGRQVEHHAVHAHLDGEVDQAELQHLAAAQGAEEAVRAACLFAGVFFGQLAFQRPLLLVAQPAGIARAVDQVEVGGNADQRGQQALGDEQPLPVGQAEDAVELQQPAGQRTAQHQRQRQAEIEQAERLGAAALREPVGEVEDDAGEEARLGDAQQEAQDIESHGVVGEHHRRRDQAPGDHDPAQPDPGAEAVQHQVAGYLEAGIADEEDARAEREGGIAEAGVGLQEGPRVTDVGPVDESQYIHQDQERQEPQAAGGDRRGQQPGVVVHGAHGGLPSCCCSTRRRHGRLRWADCSQAAPARIITSAHSSITPGNTF